MNDIQIGTKYIGDGHLPFIVAEMSGNHNQSLERALSIVDAAAATGVDALKIQTYTADTITLNVEDGDFVITDEKSLWKGKRLYDLYTEAFTPWDWHKSIYDRCRMRGIICFSTPFDDSAVDFLESLETPCYKIASFENAHLPLIRKVASTGKPIIISTGLATLAELDETVRTARSMGNEKIILLKCTSTYPATPENTNIATIPHMRQLFQCHTGLSDHTMGTGTSIAAVALGARLIEKHFTLRRIDGGVDSTFSLEPEEMITLIQETKQAWQSIGTVQYGATENEKKSLMFRRSLFIAEDVKQGEKLTPRNLRIVRPGNGLPPKYYEVFLGRTVKCDLKKGTPVSWDIL